MNKAKIVTFFYLLGRDFLPLGQIEELLESIESISVMPIFSNKHLYKYAEKITEKLSNE